MKVKQLLFVLLFLLTRSLGVKSQDSNYVHWQTAIQNTGKGQYTIQLRGAIRQGWHLYLRDKQVEGLDGIHVKLSDASIQLTGEQALNGKILRLADPVFDKKEVDVMQDSILLEQPIQFPAQVTSEIRLLVTYSIASKDAFIPEEQKLTIPVKGGVDQSDKDDIILKGLDLNHPVLNCGEVQAKDHGLMNLFFLGFLGGLVALLTPCVFPMIPLTVSFFTKNGGDKKKGKSNAILYGLFIFLIYIALSLPFHFLDHLDPQILNNISTSVVLNVAFFIIFIVFAISFFGYFDITLPARFLGKTDAKAGAGNVVGIFFMALTLALVSFSCTGPILGSLLAGSLTANGGANQLTAGMGGFGLALALPFALFALFPNWMHALPKSGGWLNTVKVVLGFVELALSLKFFSNADLVAHWGILKRELFIGLWIVIGILLTLYLLGFIHFPHDNRQEVIGRPRKAFGSIVMLFVLYLIPGLTNTKYANLTLISGFVPPLYYSYYHHDGECIMDLNCSHQYEEGLRMAREQHKPILIDFTGFACTNCRNMEENVWSKPEVFSIIRDKYILVSLYVDDKKELPPTMKFVHQTKEGREKDINTVGDKWAAFETENFKINSQPYYVLLGTDETLLNNPRGYTPDVEEYKQWLQCGIAAFKKTGK